MVSARKIARSPITWTLAVLLIVGLGVGMVLAQPWRLFTNTTVNEAAPSATAPAAPGAPAQPRTLAGGTLIAHEHDTSGTVRILQLPDGTRVLRLEDLDTSDGPDLHVWLTDAEVVEGKAGWFVFDDGRHTDLGSLKGNKGSQNYVLPADIDLTAFTSVTIWCQRFHVSFGAAQLHNA
ncbi:DM13 domain-containing protein [Nocardia sp. NPDC057030]|uniref:DM13 domain-containing protein n=1 Tax=unclassified Nocardia TaxID=2637762 RepID=UPI00363DA1B8